MWLEQNAKHKNLTRVKRKKWKKKCREEFKELNIEPVSALIWKAFEIDLGYLIYVKIFVKFCFLCGHIYKE